MDLNKVREIVPEIAEVLNRELGEKHNLKFATGRTSYGETDFSTRLTCIDLTAAGGVDSKDALTYKQKHSYYGLPADGLGKEFKYFGKVYKITGLNPKRRKYPVSAERDGKSFKFPADEVARALKTG